MGVENRESEQENLIDRETPLTTEEISAIRLPSRDIFGFKGHMYNVEGEEISILELKDKYKRDMWDEMIDKERHTENLRKLIESSKSLEHGDTYPYESLLVNAMIEQLRIAKKFDLPLKSIYTSMKLDFSEEQTMVLMDNNGFIYPFTLQKHIYILKKMGATDDQVLTEVSGHIFHESLHDIDGELTDVLFGGKHSFGEVTSITGQLAYYLEKGYLGPKGYDAQCSLSGQKKINEGGNQSFDHQIATSVSAELLLEHLRAAYPDIAEGIEAKTSLDSCEQLVAKIPPERRDVLIPALKEAILQSTDENKFKSVVE